MPNNNNEHISVTDRHIGTIINIYEYIYIYQKYIQVKMVYYDLKYLRKVQGHNNTKFR